MFERDFNTITIILTPSNTFNMCDPKATLIDEERSIDVEAETLELNTQLLKREKNWP
jgi:hypothetical protein